MYPLTLGLVTGTKEFWDEVRACSQGLPLRTVLEQTEIDNWEGFLDKLERLAPDALLLDMSGLKVEPEEALGRIKSRAPACSF